MSMSLIFLFVLNAFSLIGLAFLWVLYKRGPSEDPRLSRGLQLLQSKISILEDLSEKVEKQNGQVLGVIDRKAKDLENLMERSEAQIQALSAALEKGWAAVDHFEEKVPHAKALERENKVKYLRAAQLAHKGQSPEEIAKQVELSRAEIDLIWNVNKDHLQFDESAIPAWAERKLTQRKPQETPAPAPAASFSAPAPKQTQLKHLGDQMREALKSQASFTPSPQPEVAVAPSAPAQPEIRKVIFRQI